MRTSLDGGGARKPSPIWRGGRGSPRKPGKESNGTHVFKRTFTASRLQFLVFYKSVNEDFNGTVFYIIMVTFCSFKTLYKYVHGSTNMSKHEKIPPYVYCFNHRFI